MDFNNPFSQQHGCSTPPPGHHQSFTGPVTPTGPSSPFSPHHLQLTPGPQSPGYLTSGSTTPTSSDLSTPGGTSKMTSAPVRRYFSYDSSSQKNCCLVSDCGQLLADNTSNLERHLQRSHPDQYALLHVYKLQTPQQKRKKNCTFHVQMSPDELTSACVEIATVNGRPFTVFDDSGFKKLIDPILKGMKTTLGDNIVITPSTIRDQVQVAAAEERAQIRESVKGKLISLKLDIATCHDRSFLGVNIQYSENGMIVLKTLAMKELSDRHTGEHVKKVTEEVLESYGIPLSNVFSLTVDNGTNMVKLGELLQTHQQIVAEAEEEADRDLADEDIEDCFHEEDRSQEDTDNSVFDGILGALMFVQIVRCAAHTLQLAVNDAIKKSNLKELLDKARDAVKNIRKPTVLQHMKRMYPKSKKPTLDVITRWHSLIDMLISLLACRQFCENSLDPVLKFEKSEWDSIIMIIDSLKPAKIATKNLQSEKITLSDFYIEWLKCKGLTGQVNSTLALNLVETMEQRENTLLGNDMLLASVLLDPRHRCLLSEDEKTRATETLRSTWRKLQSLKPLDTPEQTEALPPPSMSPGNCIIWEMMQKKRSNQGQRVEQDFASQLQNYLDTNAVCFEKDLMQFWRESKQLWPALYELAAVVHSVPSTQVSVERLFSAMKFILNDLRTSLNGDILEDILLIRANRAFAKRDINEKSTKRRISIPL